MGERIAGGGPTEEGEGRTRGIHKRGDYKEAHW